MESSKFCIEHCQGGWSFIKLLMPNTFSAITHSYDTMHLQADVQNIPGVLKWHDLCTKGLFILVGSKYTLNLSLPRLSLPFTKTKLLIQGVDWCTGFRITACNIFFNSLFEWLFEIHRCQLARSLLWGNTWIYMYMVWRSTKHPMPSKTSGLACRICSLLVLSLDTIPG